MQLADSYDLLMTYAKVAEGFTVKAPPPTIVNDAPARSEVVVDAAGLTDRGRERARNEDAFLVATLERSLHVHRTNLPDDFQQSLAPDDSVLLMLVADGMGGQHGGDLASRVAVASVSAYIAHYMPWVPPRTMATVPSTQSLPDIRAELDHALAIGDSEVQSAGAQRAMPGMGTTLTLAYVAFPRLYVSHVGDSRCYLFRAGGLSRLTTDHTLAEQLRQSGRPVAAPQWDHVLWNALGGGEAGVKPEIHRISLEPGDAVMLCSDGLTKHVPDEAIASILNRMSDATNASRELVDAANAGGGSDNVTAVVARFGQRVVR